MFEKLRRRWGVGPGRVVLILCTFALGGSACGYAARKVMLWLDVEGGFIWWLLYLLIVTLLWPISVLLISIPLGQFRFFRQYIARLFQRMAPRKKAQPSSKPVAEHSLKNGQ
jgi:hypothetical protein